jgi:uncharacterized protein (DUF58 family)
MATAAATPPVRGLDPQALLSIRDLELRVRIVIEGLWAGLHRSPYTGFSVEFTEYRQYSPGDDLRHLDWKVLARTDRHFLKKFEDETNLRCLVVLDTSRSMGFGSRGWTKADYARTLAATFAYFLGLQRDVVGLALFDAKVTEYVPPRWRSGHYRRLLSLLDREPAGRDTQLGPALEEVALLCPRRSLILVISDFLAPVAEWDNALGRLVAGRHDVRAIQVLDPAEQTLDFGSTAYWEDLENKRELYIDPSRAREGYLAKFNAHQAELQAALRRRGVRQLTIPTDRPLDLALLEILQSGMTHGAAARRRVQR